MSNETPTPPQSSGLRGFWKRRSRKGKAAIIVGAVFLALIIIGIAVPSTDDNTSEQVAGEQTQETTEPATTAETTTEEMTTEEAPPPPPPLLVASVIDGDTLELDNGETVRLVQIDAPEAKGECYGRQATRALRQLLPVGTEVKIARDRRLDDRDRYDRLLRYVFKGGKNANLVLVQRGAASVWFFDGDRGRFAPKLERAADTARAKGRGAWGVCQASTNYLAAWTTTKKPPPEPEPQAASNCHPSYKGACLDPSVSDYDCAGGSGNGPAYTGFVRVVGYDEYGLDADGDGYGCE